MNQAICLKTVKLMSMSLSHCCLHSLGAACVHLLLWACECRGWAAKCPWGCEQPALSCSWGWGGTFPKRCFCGTKPCLGRSLLAVGYLLPFSLKWGWRQMVTRYLGTCNCLTNGEVPSAQGELGFEFVPYVSRCGAAFCLVPYELSGPASFTPQIFSHSLPFI